MNNKKTQISKEAADDFAACANNGKYTTMGVFVATFGVAFLAQEAYMYKSKKFPKRTNRILRPLGAAFLPAYFFFWGVLYNCKKEVAKTYPECFETKPPQKSAEFNEDD